MQIIRDIYAYREMLKSQVKKDLRTRYKGSFLGFLWTFVNPLLQLMVYTLVFKNILKIEIENFAIFLFVGLLPWLFLSTSVSGSAMNIVSNANLIKKIYFPREILPIALATGGLFNFIFGLVIVFPALYLSGINYSISLLCLPVIMLLQYMFVLGLSFIFSSINVYFRDTQHILEVFIMLWFYMTPVFYSSDIMPDNLKKLLSVNPMTRIIESYREILIYQNIPKPSILLNMLLVSCITLMIGLTVFKKLEKGFAEEL